MMTSLAQIGILPQTLTILLIMFVIRVFSCILMEMLKERYIQTDNTINYKQSYIIFFNVQTNYDVYVIWLKIDTIMRMLWQCVTPCGNTH